MAINSSHQEKNSLLQAEPNSAEQNLERHNNALRPQSFDDYIGQAELIKSLKISISAARKRGDLASLGHMLLYGPPGLGKTSLAYLLASELGTEAKVFSAPALERPKDILGILMAANEGDIIFIDEIHRLNKITEELLYPAIEDYQIDIGSGKGTSSRLMRLDINKFILVGATTKLGFISAPLRDRFIHIHRMEYYSETELARILLDNSHKLGLDLQEAAAQVIALRARATPRIANRLLRLVRDYAEHKNLSQISETDCKQALDLYRIDKAGLDSMDRKILSSMLEHYQGGPVGLETIAAITGEDKNTIEDYYEPFLIQSGFLHRTQRGRVLTQRGSEYANQISNN
ncbi:MAG: Holliday junction branch migration DNA helicase RuvB [Candidatus Melainabacteria bacterium]|nr:Holliday junction branch migration DNA helicase RuvB [Candidatus Melainabacteria bacterium]